MGLTRLYPFKGDHSDDVLCLYRNDLLAEYPELAAEVEEEIKKLEAEQIARQAEVDALQKELEEAHSDKGGPGVAFVSSSGTSSPEAASDGDFEIMDDGETVPVVDDDAGSIADEATITQEEVLLEDAEETVVDVKGEDSEVIAKNETNSKEDFTMSAITFEIIRAMIKQVENDVKRIVELMAPVIRPILRAGDVAWRHLKVVFESARRSYQNSQGGSEDEGNNVQANAE